MPEVRALPSPGVTRLQRYYDPVRLPPGPPPETASKLRTPTGRVSPDYPHCPSNVPCLIPRWTERVLASISSPSARPSPNLRRVGVHDFTFEACSGFTRVTARWIAQPPESGLCHEASARPVAQPDRSSATRFIDNFLGGTFLHWQHAPSGRTEISGLIVIDPCIPHGLAALRKRTQQEPSGIATQNVLNFCTRFWQASPVLKSRHRRAVGPSG